MPGLHARDRNRYHFEDSTDQSAGNFRMQALCGARLEAECSACRNIFDASCWDAQLIKKHRHSDRGLVCPGCTERRNAPGKYGEHHCEECREEFGSHNFEKYVLANYKKGKTKRVVCRDCQTKLRCSKCKTAYELKYWSKHERDKHGRQGTALIYKACRTLGYHPAHSATSSCQTCYCDLETRKFNPKLLGHHTHTECNTPQCMQCAAVACACKLCASRDGVVLAGQQRQRAILLAVDRIDDVRRSVVQFISGAVQNRQLASRERR